MSYRMLHYELTFPEINLIVESLEFYSNFHKGTPIEFVAKDLAEDLKLETKEIVSDEEEGD